MLSVGDKGSLGRAYTVSYVWGKCLSAQVADVYFGTKVYFHVLLRIAFLSPCSSQIEYTDRLTTRSTYYSHLQ